MAEIARHHLNARPDFRTAALADKSSRSEIIFSRQLSAADAQLRMKKKHRTLGIIEQIALRGHIYGDQFTRLNPSDVRSHT